MPRRGCICGQRTTVAQAAQHTRTANNKQRQQIANASRVHSPSNHRRSVLECYARLIPYLWIVKEDWNEIDAFRFGKSIVQYNRVTFCPCAHGGVWIGSGLAWLRLLKSNRLAKHSAAYTLSALISIVSIIVFFLFTFRSVFTRTHISYTMNSFLCPYMSCDECALDFKTKTRSMDVEEPKLNTVIFTRTPPVCVCDIYTNRAFLVACSNYKILHRRSDCANGTQKIRAFAFARGRCAKYLGAYCLRKSTNTLTTGKWATFCSIDVHFNCMCNWKL